MTRHFCTYFDINYASRGLALLQSLKKHCSEDFRFYVLCLDDDVLHLFEKMADKQMVVIRLKDLELWDADLLTARGNRSLIEYYFTLSPVLPLYVLETYSPDIITYLDADLLFFSDPGVIYDELGESSILITEHRFSDKLKHLKEYGRFNVQYQSFLNDDQGKSCLYRWREQCIAWCYDQRKDGKFADQKYLDEWPEIYDRLVISHNPGVGLAPWNTEGHSLKKEGEKWLVNGTPLVFYHFHGLKILGGNLIKTGLGVYSYSPCSTQKQIYRYYVQLLNDIRIIVGNVAGYEEVRHGHGFIKLMYLGFRQGDLMWLPDSRGDVSRRATVKNNKE